MTKTTFFAIAALIIVGIIGYIGFSIDQQFNGFPSNSPKGEYTFEVKSGETLSDVADTLKKDNIINNKDAFLLQEKWNESKPLQQGEYTITVPAKPVELIEQINKETQEKIDALSKIPNLPVSRVVFKEGYTLDQMIEILDKEGIAKKEDLVSFAQKPENFNRELYSFLPKPLDCTYGDLSNCAKYYVEGYLYPDTYDFYKPSEPKDVYDKMLSNFNKKVWSQVRQNLNGKNFDEAVIMASVLEKETGRTKGITEANKAEVSSERKVVAGVFYNRLSQNIKWQSNPTSEYGHGQILCESTFARPGCKYLDDQILNTKYNTYNITGYPIGPISNPQLDNIQAVLNPTKTDYLFFVADATGKTYFSKNETEHQAVIDQVNKINRELGVA
jgi:UPF0755 protein